MFSVKKNYKNSLKKPFFFQEKKTGKDPQYENQVRKQLSSWSFEPRLPAFVHQKVQN